MITLIAGGAFAQIKFSAGGGGLFDFSGNNGYKYDDWFYYGYRNTSFGGFIFFDVTYAELDVNFAYGSISPVAEILGIKLTTSDSEKLSAMQLGFSLLGKYPINLGSFTVFPMLGVDYNIVISVKDKDGNKDPNPGYWNQFGFLAGVGGDFNITKSIFIRAEGLFHIRLPNKNMKDAIGDDDDVSATWGMGPRIKIGVGFRF
jgi:opacity protein-like surface antigen